MPSLADQPLVAFVPCSDPARARAFYEGTLELPLRSDDGFALVFAVGERFHDPDGNVLSVSSHG